MKKGLTSLSGILIMIGSLMIIVFGALFIFNSTGLRKTSIDTSVFAHFGDIIGGFVGTIFSLVGILLLIQTLRLQGNQFQLQQYENHFFELLKIHRENVGEMVYRGENGRSVIVRIVNEFFQIVMIVQQSKIIYNHKLDDQDLINVSYLILFFGVDETVNDVLENRFLQHYSYDVTTELLELVKELRTKKRPRNPNKYLYNGHQSRLGHYFRHLFNSIIYIHKNTLLEEKQKKNFIKFFRIQLSTHEQILLFFNSVSDLGLNWELAPNIEEKNKLITRYNLIKNIPFGSIYGFKPRRYYPFVKFENQFEVRL